MPTESSGSASPAKYVQGWARRPSGREGPTPGASHMFGQLCVPAEGAGVVLVVVVDDVEPPDVAA